MPLGNFFPPDYARMQVERQLQPGMVVKFEAKMDDGAFHEKRFVILDATEKTFTCVINSKVTAFIANRPDMVACQVPIDQASHPYMSWDSHVDCSRIRVYTRAEIVNQLCKNPDWVLGAVCNDVLGKIVNAIEGSRTIPKALAAQCCASVQRVIEADLQAISSQPASINDGAS